MSEYFDNKQLFSSPKVSQYGSHMVMSNVVKNTKVKYINIDTKYSDEPIKPFPGTVSAQTTRCQCSANAITNLCQCLQRKNFQTNMNVQTSYKTSSYTITLPEKINDVKSISVVNAEIPITFYNISDAKGNNCIIVSNATSSKVNIIPNGNYTTANLVTTLNSVFLDNSFNNGLYITCSHQTGDYTNLMRFTSNGGNAGEKASVNFAVNSSGQPDKYKIKSKLGWLLGFRDLSYSVARNFGIKSESVFTLASMNQKYFYLSVEEFSKGSESSFLSFSSNSQVPNKNLAKIGLDRQNYPYGTVQTSSINNGLLVSDTRRYNGKVDIQKLVVKLIDENGETVNLNGSDFSFCLKVEYE